jgi:hypothetical protein
MSWPDDADGDVFRRLQADHFDFSSPHQIDFNVDFDSWPPHPGAVQWLQQQYGEVHIYEPGEDLVGYVQFSLTANLTYDLVTSTQETVSMEMEKYGGVCESWGVLH